MNGVSPVPWLLVALVAGPAAAGAEDAWQLVGTGHEAHPGLQALRRRLEEAVRTSRLELEARWGLRPGKLPVRYRLDLSRQPPAGGPSTRTRAPGEAFELGATTFDGETVVVTLPARKLLRAADAAAIVAAHENAHALLASALGSRARYEAVPAWFREGLAADFAGEGSELVAEAMVEALLEKRRANGFLVGIPEGPAAGEKVPPPAPVSPAESWLAVRALSSRLGERGPAAIVERLLRGDPLEHAIEAATGLAGDRFRLLAAESAKAELARLLPREDEAAFLLVLEAREHGDARRTVERAGKLLARAPQGPLAGTLGYFLARAELEGAAPGVAVPRARTRLEAMLRRPLAAWRPEALVLLGECLLREGHAAAARERFAEVLEAYGEDDGPAARARAGLARAVVQ